MGVEAYQIKDYFQDKAVAFADALNPKCKLACNEDEMYSTERLKLESYNPEDNTQVATFFMKSTLQKMKLLLLTPIFKRFKKSTFFSSHHQNTCPVYDAEEIKKREQKEAIKKLYP